MESRASRRMLTVTLTMVAALVVAAVGVFASRVPGYASTSVQAEQRAAWVTSGKDLMMGLLNQQTHEVESPISLESPDTELLQQNSTVVILDRTQHALRTVNPITAVLSDKVRVPERADLAISQSTLVVTDQRNGNFWVVPSTAVGTDDLTSEKPNGTAAPGAVATVAGASVTVAAPGSDVLTTMDAGGEGDAQQQTVNRPERLSAVTAKDPAPVSISSVGAQAVVLDAPAGKIVVPSPTGIREFALPPSATHPVLQQPGPISTTVLVGTDAALLRVNLTSGAVQSQLSTVRGAASAPVLVAGCAHEAWAGASARYLAWCGDTPKLQDIGSVTKTSDLIFRVNDNTVVLNDVTTGNSWVLDATMILVNNWDQIRTDNNDLNQSASGTQGEASRLTTARTDCTQGMAPPRPKDDSYGVRPGHPAVLRVLDNDASSTCSIALISRVDGPAGVGTIVDGGQALQVGLPANSTAPVQLSYTVDDGAGHQGSAKVTVTPVTTASPIAPKKVRDSSATVTAGGTVTQQVLSDWISPSGDSLFLTAAVSSDPDDRISYSPDGYLTVGDTGTSGLTKKTITFNVSDGTNAVPGRLTVQVVDEAKAHPVASPLAVSGIVGEQISAEPLKSVLWPGSESLTLTKIELQKSTPGLSVTPDLRSGTVSFVGSRAGTYYLDYQVAAGDKQASGVLRVDVRNRPTEQLPPVAMTDTAYLATAGSTLIDLTANDFDPSGGIVAVQRIDTSAAPGGGGNLIIQSIDMHLAQISARQPLPSAGVWVKYTISAGGPSADGWLQVLPVPPPTQPMSPTATPIQVSVRAGDAVTIPIAKYATDPEGDLVTPVPFGADAIGADQGLLFTNSDSVRYMAPVSGPVAQGKTLRTQYTVTNQTGQRASANLAITVVPVGGNSPPLTPPTAQARVFVGDTVDVPLPIDGIDPDGDWAIAATIANPATLGSAAVAGTSTIRYGAFDRPGLDSFTYTITDPYGGASTGTVQVLVVPLPKTADPPVAPNLHAVVAPSKAIAVNVLDEVTDPGGQAVSFAEPAFGAPSASSGITATQRGSTIVFKAGPKATSVSLPYNVQNERQRTASGTITLTVDPNAPKVPPTAKDVLVVDSMISAGNQQASVNLASYVANPGGLPEDLTAAVPRVSQGRLTVTGKQTLSVSLTDQRQVLAYQVVNAERLTAEAFLIVPSRGELNIAPPPRAGQQPQQKKPEPKPAAKPEVFAPKGLQSLVVQAGTEVQVKVAQYIGGTKDGRKVTLPADGSNTAQVGELRRLDADTLLWKVPADAEGKTQLTVTVTDGVAKPVRTAIPATIKNPKPKAALFQDRGISVEPGSSSAPISLLQQVTYDSTKTSKLRFTLKNRNNNGLTAQLAGDQFTVSAPASVRKGTSATFGVAVNDGINPEVTAQITVSVISSSKPLASVPGVSVQALAGQPTTVNVLAGATNPFGSGQPLTLLNIAGASTYTATSSQSGAVTITANPDYTGTLTVPFVVADASGDPARNVQSQLTVTVRGKPSRPGVATTLQVGDRTATIQWTDSVDNGSPITGYTVSGNGFSQDCPASPCTLTGLQNNKTYTFAVVAHNAVGDSPASRASAGIRPDTSPQAPGTPKLTAGDRSLNASWPQSANSGSPITSYQVQISPPPAGSAGLTTVSGSTLQLSLANLANGTQYTVKVRALNASGTPSDWSPAISAVPAGKPGTPTALSVSAANAAGAAKRIDVSWTAAADNGDAPRYVMAWKSDKGQSGTVQIPAGTTSAAIDPAQLGVNYSVTVTAINKAGNSAPTPPKSVSPFTAPGQVTDLAAAATGADGTVSLNWSAPPNNGRPINGYSYTDGKNGWRDTGSTATFFTVPTLTNGTGYTFQVRACTAEKGNNCGQDSNGTKAVPYGAPGPAANLAANVDTAAGQANLQWAAANGNGRPIDHYTVSDGADSQNVAADATRATLKDLANGQSYTFTVVAVTAEKSANQSTSASVQATPYDVPGAPTNVTVAATGVAHEVTVDWTNGAANGRPLSSFDYSTDSGGTWASVDKGQKVASGSDGAPLQDGTSYTFIVRAHTGAPQRNVSAPSAATTGSPYGPIANPILTATNPSGNVATVKWSWPAANGRPVASKTVTIDGTAVDPNTGLWSQDVGAAKTVTGVATFCVSGPNDCTSATQTVTTPNPPPPIKPPPAPANPAVVISKGTSAVGYTGGSPGSTKCTDSSCAFIVLTLSNWNGQATCKLSGGMTTGPERFGNGRTQTGWYFGFKGKTVTATCTGSGVTKSDSITW